MKRTRFMMIGLLAAMPLGAIFAQSGHQITDKLRWLPEDLVSPPPGPAAPAIAADTSQPGTPASTVSPDQGSAGTPADTSVGDGAPAAGGAPVAPASDKDGTAAPATASAAEPEAVGTLAAVPPDGATAAGADAPPNAERSKPQEPKQAARPEAAAPAMGTQPPAETKKAQPVPAKKLFGAAKTGAPLKERAIGWYAKGCLAGGVELAKDGPAWQAMRLSRNRNWAHPKLVDLLERFAIEMKTKDNWPGLLIGDLSQPRGGPMLTGHKSHQVGLDADIWFKPKPKKTLTVAERESFEPLLLAKDNGTEVIAENWDDGFHRLVKRAASYPEVERIFLHPAIKKKLCEVAGTDRAWLGKVRPMWLHNYHFHVRIGCPSGSPTCEKQKPVAGNDGCGKELDDWIKLVSRPAKPAPVPAKKPAKPPQPRPEMTLAQLPPECKAVLAAGENAPPSQSAGSKPEAKGEPKKSAEAAKSKPAAKR